MFKFYGIEYTSDNKPSAYVFSFLPLVVVKKDYYGRGLFIGWLYWAVEICW